MTKGQFLDVLKNTAATVVTEPYQTQTTAVTEKEEDPKWSILREDFMMGANMKDWDKEGSEGEEGMEANEVD
ncbi:hypothetical protein NP493_1458g00062 [Ridgeia piscesae]|uniref:RRP15-like protein n=1 Tax=Ridgeia piscesae TaxID=27915 RepID=A0AAD9K3R1_RIDPI|nr:hypothetical protein NP493_1458g00062 [Ridgeia piscesae]